MSLMATLADRILDAIRRMKTANSGAMRSDSPSPRSTFDFSVAIRRPPSTVFALLADIQDAEPIPRSAAVRMVKEPTGPTTIGTRWHEWVRVAPRCWLHVESVVSDVHEPYRLAMDFRSRWLTGHLPYDIEPAGDGSILHQRETVRPRALLRWLSPFIERRMRLRLMERLADIKRSLKQRRSACLSALQTSRTSRTPANKQKSASGGRGAAVELRRPVRSRRYDAPTTRVVQGQLWRREPELPGGRRIHAVGSERGL